MLSTQLECWEEYELYERPGDAIESGDQQWWSALSLPGTLHLT